MAETWLLAEIEKARPMPDLRNDVDFREVIGAPLVESAAACGK